MIRLYSQVHYSSLLFAFSIMEKSKQHNTFDHHHHLVRVVSLCLTHTQSCSSICFVATAKYAVSASINMYVGCVWLESVLCVHMKKRKQPSLCTISPKLFPYVSWKRARHRRFSFESHSARRWWLLLAFIWMHILCVYIVLYAVRLNAYTSPSNSHTIFVAVFLSGAWVCFPLVSCMCLHKIRILQLRVPW